MTGEDAVAFWSYAHKDNRRVAGAIVGLAERLSEEYSLLHGDDLSVFVDRKDLSWGEHWKERIDKALVTTTFFMPVVTPTYFKSDECRRELFEFVRHAKSLGVTELVCPILYVPVDDLNDQNSDEAVVLIAQANYADWTRLRLQDEQSPGHKEAVNKLANELAAVANKVGSRQAKREREYDDADEKAGLGETLEEIRLLLPDWLDALETDGLLREQFLAIDSVLGERKRKLRRGPAGARYAIFRRQVAEYLPLLEKRHEAEQLALKKTIELSPLITRAIRTVESHPENYDSLSELREALTRSEEAYRKWDVPMERIVTWARRNAHETRGMLTLAEISRRNEVTINEVYSVIELWRRELKALDTDTRAPELNERAGDEPDDG